VPVHGKDAMAGEEAVQLLGGGLTAEHRDGEEAQS